MPLFDLVSETLSPFAHGWRARLMPMRRASIVYCASEALTVLGHRAGDEG